MGPTALILTPSHQSPCDTSLLGSAASHVWRREVGLCGSRPEAGPIAWYVYIPAIKNALEPAWLSGWRTLSHGCAMLRWCTATPAASPLQCALQAPQHRNCSHMKRSAAPFWNGLGRHLGHVRMPSLHHDPSLQQCSAQPASPLLHAFRSVGWQWEPAARTTCARGAPSCSCYRHSSSERSTLSLYATVATCGAVHRVFRMMAWRVVSPAWEPSPARWEQPLQRQ